MDTDHRFYHEVYAEAEYKPCLQYPVVYDVGCNIGMFSLWIAPYAKQIYAYDISPAAITATIELVLEKDLPITTHRQAITERHGFYKINSHGTDGMDGSWYIDGIGKDIEGLSLVEAMAQDGVEYIDLLKVDIEGGEREIFTKDFPYDKVSTIIGEVHSGNNDYLDMLKHWYHVTIDKHLFLAR